MAPAKPPDDPELAAALAATRRAFAAGGDEWAALALWLDLLAMEDGRPPTLFKGGDLQAERVFRLLDARLGRAEGVQIRRRWRRARAAERRRT